MTSPTQVRTGCRQWVNPRNGCTVLELHYSADPARRSPEWKAAESQAYTPRAWRREQEIDWTAPAGDPVIPTYDARVHVAPCRRDPRTRLLRFWDFGFVSPVVLFAQRVASGQLQVLRELCPFNTPLAELVPMMRAITGDYGTETGVWDAGDPAAENQTDLGASATILQRDYGIRLHACRPGTEVSYSDLRKGFLATVYSTETGRVPAILLDLAGTPRLQSALAGGFALSEHPPHKPIKKHPEKDLVDALRYGWDNLGQESQAWRESLRRVASADAAW